MNSGEIFVLCLILIIVLGGIAKRYFATRQPKPQQDPQYHAKLDALEERVQTLERIVTDKGYDLKREFDKL